MGLSDFLLYEDPLSLRYVHSRRCLFAFVAECAISFFALAGVTLDSYGYVSLKNSQGAIVKPCLLSFVSSL
jgi:hypothetical protein